MAKVKPRVKGPRKVKAGEVVTVQTLISHPMESGHRTDRKTGDVVPRKIINRFEATFNGEIVILIDMDPAVSANPYFKFDMVVPEAGTLALTWTDDDGTIYTKERKIALV